MKQDITEMALHFAGRGMGQVLDDLAHHQSKSSLVQPLVQFVHHHGRRHQDQMEVEVLGGGAFKLAGDPPGEVALLLVGPVTFWLEAVPQSRRSQGHVIQRRHDVVPGTVIAVELGAAAIRDADPGVRRAHKTLLWCPGIRRGTARRRLPSRTTAIIARAPIRRGKAEAPAWLPCAGGGPRVKPRCTVLLRACAECV